MPSSRAATSACRAARPSSRRAAGSDASSPPNATRSRASSSEKPRSVHARRSSAALGAGSVAAVVRDRIVGSRDSGFVVERIHRSLVPGLFEGLQERVRGLEPQPLRARDRDDASGGLVGPAGGEGEGLAHAVDADLHALGLDREEIGMQALENAAAAAAAKRPGRRRGTAAAPPGAATAPSSAAVRRPRQQERSGKRLGRGGEPLEHVGRGERHDRPKRSARIRHVRTKTAPASALRRHDGDPRRARAARSARKPERTRSWNSRAADSKRPGLVSRPIARARPSRGSRS